MTFDTFFQTATGNPAPYDYQRRLAGDTAGRPCESQLINIPTGLGKTAAVVLAWLWNRVVCPSQTSSLSSEIRDPVAPWPRRLVYCLPMRTLVEQTRDETCNWVAKLVDAGLIPADRKPRIVVLMGGEALEEEGKDWDIHPEADDILIGTQDMLLSRALNRGYGLKRYQWSRHFGLLNNDCLWVMDETQLMGPGLSTACQLEAFRSSSSQSHGSTRKLANRRLANSATCSRGREKARRRLAFWRPTAPGPLPCRFPTLRPAGSHPLCPRISCCVFRGHSSSSSSDSTILGNAFSTKTSASREAGP